MDTSEKYIKMCEQALEIQQLKYYKDLHIGRCLDGGDFYFDKNMNQIEVISFGEIAHENIVWLPRQDQLQEMICGKIDVFEVDSLLFRLNDFIKEEQPWYNTFEQLLLGFVMRFKFNKKWGGEREKWI